MSLSSDDLQKAIVDVEEERRAEGSRSGGSSASEVTMAEDADGYMEEDDEAEAAVTSGRQDDLPDAPLELGLDLPLPRFLREAGAGAWRHCAWVPFPVRRFCAAAANWTRGPDEARVVRLTPLLPRVQSAPLRLLARILPEEHGRRARATTALYLGWLALWACVFALVRRHGEAASELAGWGAPADIGCDATYWLAGNRCGLDGGDCRPFNNSGFAFRCPAGCATFGVSGPRAVGDQEVLAGPLVVGGGGSLSRDSSPSNSSPSSASPSNVSPSSASPSNASPSNASGTSTPPYRGDSFICAAAVHAGIVSHAAGGCGVVRLVGRQRQFAPSRQHGIDSIGFDSYFPLAFAFERSAEADACRATDMRWALLAVSVGFSAVLALFVAAPAPFFFAVFAGLFWHVGLASDPPPQHAASAGDLAVALAGAFLPAALASVVLYTGVRRTLAPPPDPGTHQLDKAVLWLGGAWVGALANVTLPRPLTPTPGALLASPLLLLAATAPLWALRQERRLRRLLRLYALLAVGLLAAALLLPGLHLRLPAYALALLLLPATAVQTRPALLFQGLLVGLFVHSLARDGWVSLLQTAAAGRSPGHAPQGTPLPQLLEPPVVSLANGTAATAAAAAAAAALGLAASAAALSAAAASIAFRWAPSPGLRYDGISVLVNDVERFRGYYEDFAGQPPSFVWERRTDAASDDDEYFRFAYMEGSRSADYTKAGKWTAAGDWVPMAPGPSRARGEI